MDNEEEEKYPYRFNVCNADDDYDEEAAKEAEAKRKHEVTRWKFHIATLIVGVVLFLLSAIILADIVQNFRGASYTPPQFLVDICKLTITAGLTVLGVGGVQAMKSIGRRGSKQIESEGKPH